MTSPINFIQNAVNMVTNDYFDVNTYIQDPINEAAINSNINNQTSSI